MPRDYDDDDDRPRRRRPRDDDDYDRPRRKRKPQPSGTNTVLLIVGLVVLAVILGCAGLIVKLVFLGKSAQAEVQKAVVELQQQMQVEMAKSAGDRNLEKVAKAMLTVAGNSGSYPPQALRTKDGRPGLSWRVAVLPQLGRDDLYKRFKLDEPWDSPTNKALLGEMPEAFRSGGEGTGSETRFQVFVGGGALFEQERAVSTAQVPDGPANTLLVVEAGQAVPWTKPDDLLFFPKQVLPGLGKPGQDYFLGATADGKVRRFPLTFTQEQRRALVTKAGGEPVTLPREEIPFDPDAMPGDDD